eukprot:UN33078
MDVQDWSTDEQNYGCEYYSLEAHQLYCKYHRNQDGITASQACAECNCVQTDECQNAEDNQVKLCGQNTNCEDKLGGYTCSCMEGYYDANQDGDCIEKQCTNSDDCNMGQSGYCLDFQCVCQEGFELSSDGTMCEDKNECVSGSHNCGVNRECVNVMGSFECPCGYGWMGEDCSIVKISTACEDENDNCDRNAICVNGIGESFTCSCLDDYFGDGVTCELKQCTLDSDCHLGDYGRCTNYRCGCAEEYVLHEQTCIEDINECLSDDLNNCDTNATCTNNVSGYGCSCNTGFEGDGVQCTAQCPPGYRYENDECEPDSPEGYLDQIRQLANAELAAQLAVVTEQRDNALT